MDAGFVRSVHSVLPSFIPSKNDSFCWRGRWTQFARRLLQRINRQRTTANQVTFYSATVQPLGKPMALDHLGYRNTPTLSMSLVCLICSASPASMHRLRGETPPTPPSRAWHTLGHASCVGLYQPDSFTGKRSCLTRTRGHLQRAFAVVPSLIAELHRHSRLPSASLQR